MIRYKIADLILDFYPDFSDNINGFEPFIADIPGEPDVKVYLEGCHEIDTPKGKLLLDKWTKWYEGDNGLNSYVACINDINYTDWTIWKYEINNWREVSVKYVKGIKGVENGAVIRLNQTLFRNLIALHKGVLLHASALIWNDMGIAFTAPSGTGKSTHTSLWEKHFGAKVINDDTPAIRLINDSPIIYGTPWSGSNDKHLNLSAPLGHIFILEQSSRNEVRKLQLNEVVASLLPRFLFPFYYDKHLMEKAFSVCDQIIKQTPVYLLKCRPDQEAAELACQCIS